MQLLDRRTLELIREAAVTPQDPDAVERDNGELIERLAPVIDEVFRAYFRFEVEGIDTVPRGPALMVFNHEAGISFAQILGMGARWYLRRGTSDPIMALMHDAMFGVPLLGNFLARLGAVRASRGAARAVLERGVKIAVAPGGNLEAFRPWSERHLIKFGGHRGWARLALETGTTVVPIVFSGGHDTFLVLHDGHQLARLLGMHRWLRTDTFPVFLGLPWGLGVGPLFHLPLPVKCAVRFLEPIEVARDASGDAAAVDDLYVRVASRMQAALYEMGERHARGAPR
jgi:1-acyl-sn-glycerol-3-phosphate acyltransferase